MVILSSIILNKSRIRFRRIIIKSITNKKDFNNEPQDFHAHENCQENIEWPTIMIANQRMGRLDCHTSATTNKLECLTFPTGGKYWLDGANRENIESENKIYIYILYSSSLHTTTQSAYIRDAISTISSSSKSSVQ